MLLREAAERWQEAGSSPQEAPGTMDNDEPLEPETTGEKASHLSPALPGRLSVIPSDHMVPET